MERDPVTEAEVLYNDARRAFGRFVPPDDEREYTLQRADHAREAHRAALAAVLAGMKAPERPDGPYARCEACLHTVALADLSPTDPCPRCGADRMVAIVEVERPAADAERRDPAPDMSDDVRMALTVALGDEDEPHVCTCAHSPERGLVGCSDGFGDRCRFELAIRKVLDR